MSAVTDDAEVSCRRPCRFVEHVSGCRDCEDGPAVAEGAEADAYD